MNNKRLITLIIFILIFSFIVTSIWLKYTCISQQKTIYELNNVAQNYKDIISNLENRINELSKDTRIICIAINELDMEFPEPDDIICVQRCRINKSEFNYTFQNFLSPEAIAADR